MSTGLTSVLVNAHFLKVDSHDVDNALGRTLHLGSTSGELSPRREEGVQKNGD